VIREWNPQGVLFCENFFRLTLTVLMGAGVAFSQADSTSATLKGKILDAQGSVIGGAALTLINSAKGSSSRAQAGSDGSYTLPPAAAR
jgi:hypothetical protein